MGLEQYNTLAATLKANRAKGCVSDVCAVYLAPIAATCCITLALLFPRCLDGLLPYLSAALVTPVTVPVKYTVKSWTLAGGTKTMRSVAHYAVTPIDIWIVCILLPAAVFLTRIKVTRAFLQRALPHEGRPCCVPCLCCRRRTAEFGVHVATHAAFALILVALAARIALLGVPVVVRGGSALLIVLGTVLVLAAVGPFVFLVVLSLSTPSDTFRLAPFIAAGIAVVLLTGGAIVLIGESVRVPLVAAWAVFVPMALLFDLMCSRYRTQARLCTSSLCHWRCTTDTAMALLLWVLLACVVVAVVALPLLLAEPFYPCGTDSERGRGAGPRLGGDAAAACVRPSLFTSGSTFNAWAASINRDWTPAALLFINGTETLTVGESPAWQDGLGGWCERWLLPVAWLVWLLPVSTLITLRALTRLKYDDKRLLAFAFEDAQMDR